MEVPTKYLKTIKKKVYIWLDIFYKYKFNIHQLKYYKIKIIIKIK